MPSRSKLGTSRGMTRKANEIAPRWRKTLTREALGRVGEVEVAAVVELAHPFRRHACHCLERREQVLLVQRRALGERRDRAVRAQHRRLVDLEVDVARAELDRDSEDGVQVHSASR
jgi:hypothetical protein